MLIGFAPGAGADAAIGSATYCVTAGVAARIASRSRAVRSTRSGVACERSSVFSRSLSVSSARSSFCALSSSAKRRRDSYETRTR
jgi:hypothetical protein